MAIQAALAGDRGAIIVLAKAYDSGEGLGSRSRSWVKAASWYTSAIGTESSDEDGHYDGTMDNPTYQLLARLAEMYRDGGYELQVDAAKAAELFTQAAESAMTAMKGRLANKYASLLLPFFWNLIMLDSQISSSTAFSKKKNQQKKCQSFCKILRDYCRNLFEMSYQYSVTDVD